MTPDEFHKYLNKLVYSGVRRDRIEAEIEEHTASEEERIQTFDFLEELFVDLELAKQARAKVRDNFLVATTVFLAALGASAFTMFRIDLVFLLVVLAMLIAGFYAFRYLNKMLKPLEDFSPRMNKEPSRLIKRRL